MSPNHDPSTVHGALVLRGYDRPGALVHALRYLVTRPSDLATASFEPGDIDLAWTRGFGPYGGVIIRFTTNLPTLQRLADITSRRELEHRINEGVTDTHEMMEAIVTPTTSRWDSDPLVTHRIYSRDVDDGNAETANEAHRRFLSILCADQHIDVAAYDQVRLNPGVHREGWRIFDLACRGPVWLNRYIDDANLLSKVNEQGAPDQIEDYLPEDQHEYARAALQVADHDQDIPSGSYWYIRVHDRDRPGLFGSVDHFVRTAPGSHRGSTQRQVLRSCYRSFSQHAIVLAVVPAESGDVHVLQAQLEQMLDDHRRVDESKHPTKFGIRKAARFDPAVEVSPSGHPPSVVGFSCTKKLFSMVFTAPNTTGIMLRLCEAALSVQGSEASIYHLDASTNMNSQAPAETYRGTIGWVIEENTLAGFAKTMKDTLLDLGGQGQFYGDEG